MYKKQIIFMVIMFVIVSNWVLAKDLGVTITKISGYCEVMKAGEVEWIKAKVDMRLYLNDRIRTKFLSNATVEFDDGTTIDLKEFTLIEVKELFEDRWTGRTKSEMKLWIGKILGTIEKLKTKNSEFNIHTPVAVIGIRGTKIKVNVGKNGETTCLVLSGKAQMRGVDESEDKWTTIEKDEYATCLTGDKVTKSKEVKPLPPKEEEIPTDVKPIPPEEEKEISPLSEILKERERGRYRDREIIREKVSLPENKLLEPEVEKPPLPKCPLPPPKITVQFPGQNKPFINEPPNVTVFILHPADIEGRVSSAISTTTQIPACFLQIGDAQPIKLSKGVAKYRFKPHLKPGPNALIIKAYYENGEVESTAVHFPLFDPYPPIIQEKRYQVNVPKELVKKIKDKLMGGLTGNIAETETEIKEEVIVDIFVTVVDSGSEIKDVIVNNRKMEKERIEYKAEVPLNAKMTIKMTIKTSSESGTYIISKSREYEVKKVKLENVELKVTDKADNVTIEILDLTKVEEGIRRRLQKELDSLLSQVRKR